MYRPFSELLAFASLFVLLTLSAEGQEPDAATVQAKLEKWVETKQATSKEKSDWDAKKAMLRDLNEIRRAEIEKLSEFAAAAEYRIEEIETKRAKFSDEETRLKAWRKEMTEKTEAIENSLRPLLSRMPPPLREKVSESVTRLQTPEADTPLQTRTRDVLLILQAVLEFQNAITIDGDVREVDGKRREVDILYFGLSRAWFCDRNGSYGGYGKVTDKGWEWVDDNRVAAEVRKTIDVRRRDVPPELVELPFPAAE
jgi:hypothetical protein